MEAMICSTSFYHKPFTLSDWSDVYKEEHTCGLCVNNIPSE
jgi:hypothetical protein